MSKLCGCNSCQQGVQFRAVFDSDLLWLCNMRCQPCRQAELHTTEHTFMAAFSEKGNAHRVVDTIEMRMHACTPVYVQHDAHKSSPLHFGP